VIEAAKELFWANGYHETAVSDLEERTGLSRSSLYLAFGTKRALFGAAIDRYEDTFIGPRIGIMEQERAGLDEIKAFFASVKDVLVNDPEAERGCFMVNTIAELASRDPDAAERGRTYRDELRNAFEHALEGGLGDSPAEAGATRDRAWLLTAVTLGIWLCARLDAADAATLCDLASSEVDSWRSAPPQA
jgi:AcrR family transcriptional regulator